MQPWRAISISIGGVVAVGFIDEDRVIVGSHSGIGVFDVHTGERVERTHDEDYTWFQGDPPFIRYPSAEGVRLIRAAGRWGGDLYRGQKRTLCPPPSVDSYGGTTAVEQALLHDHLS